MKKFLTVLSCLVVFGVIVTLCYFFGSVRYDIQMPVGNYYLVEVRQGTDKEQLSSSTIENSEFYLAVYENNKTKSFSGEAGFVQDGVVYDCKISGTSLKVYNGEELCYEGLFAEKLIIICFEVEEEDTSTYYEYRYELKNS